MDISPPSPHDLTCNENIDEMVFAIYGIGQYVDPILELMLLQDQEEDDYWFNLWLSHTYESDAISTDVED